MDIRLTLHPKTRTKLLHQCHHAYAVGDLRLGKRIEAILNYAEGDTYAEVGAHMNLSEQSVRNYVQA